MSCGLGRANSVTSTTDDWDLVTCPDCLRGRANRRGWFGCTVLALVIIVVMATICAIMLDPYAPGQ